MKDRMTDIYIRVSSERHEAVFSGLRFIDFINCATIPIDNILLLKSGYSSEKRCHNFELLEGQENISKLMLENIYHYGDFCFVDYAHASSVNKLNEKQIAELLYLAHMHKPLRSPFFEVLQNNFVYLAHDDGWYCKLSTSKT